MRIINTDTVLYTVEEVEEFLAKVLLYKYQGHLEVDYIFKSLHKIGFKIKSMSNNSFNVTYYGKRISYSTSFIYLRQKVHTR